MVRLNKNHISLEVDLFGRVAIEKDVTVNANEAVDTRWGSIDMLIVGKEIGRGITIEGKQEREGRDIERNGENIEEREIERKGYIDWKVEIETRKVTKMTGEIGRKGEIGERENR